jgi:hypothetical protein
MVRSDGSSRTLAELHAPIFVLHPAETFAPMAADVFIDESSLVWRQSDTEAAVVAPPGNVNASDLGVESDDPYSHVDGAIKAVAHDLTRPFDSNTKARLEGLPVDKGFALMNRHPSPGHVATSYELEQRLQEAPIYYEVQPRSGETLICYWLFFGSSAPPVDGLKAKARNVVRRIGDRLESASQEEAAGPQRHTREPELDVDDFFRLITRRHAHQGDWEGVTARVSADGELQEVHFRAHHGGHKVASSALRREGRVLVFCSRGSHACFESPSSPNNRDGDEIPSDGLLWDPLQGTPRLLDVVAQPWYGYGGAWGDPGLDHRLHIDVMRKDTAGPLGPSQFKRIWPSE